MKYVTDLPLLVIVMREMSDISERRKTVLTASAVILPAAVALLTGYAKIEALEAWRYMSDLFSFDHAIGETLRGNLGLEFTYGNTFGEHGYLFFFLLLPFKAVLKGRLVLLMVMLAPAFYLAMALVLQRVLRSITDGTKAAILSMPTLFCVMSLRGLLEPTYGFHPDTFAGFLAVCFTAYLVSDEWRTEDRDERRSWPYAWAAWLTIFILLKEEMALLAILYFLCAFLISRKKKDAVLLLVCGAVLICDVVLMKVCRTALSGGGQSFRSIGPIVQNLSIRGIGGFISGSSAVRFLGPCCAYAIAFKGVST